MGGRLKRLWRFGRLGRLGRDRSGVAATEFALTLPFILGTGLMGLEVANLALTQMRVSQLAIHIADNASRIGDTSTLENRRIYESDIYDIFAGANMQAGARMDLFQHGRVIISSLEVVPDTESDQYIHQQWCMGLKDHNSTYGVKGDGESGGIAGMGPPGEQVRAFADEAVIFVEIAYDYQPLVGAAFSFADELTATAAFNVRDHRDLSQVYQRDPDNPVTPANCSVFRKLPGT